MIITSVFDKLDGDIVLCLGRFDGLHLGHREVLAAAKKQAEKSGARLAVFTIRNENAERSIYSFDEFIYSCERAGADVVIYADESKEFYSIEPEVFTDILCNNFSLKAVAFGEDFTYGALKKGNAKTLREYCIDRKIMPILVPLYNLGGEKVSSSKIKNLISDGEIEKSAKLLCCDYFAIGRVLAINEFESAKNSAVLTSEYPKCKVKLPKAYYLTEIDFFGKSVRGVTVVSDNDSLLSCFGKNEDIRVGDKVCVRFVSRINEGFVENEILKKLK